MKKKVRRLKLDRETLRNLTPEKLEGIAGGDSDETRPVSVCNSCRPFRTLCC